MLLPIIKVFALVLSVLLLLAIIFVTPLTDGTKRPYLEAVGENFAAFGKMVMESTFSESQIEQWHGSPLLPKQLVDAVKHDDIATIRQALDHGFDPATPDYSVHMTLMHHAARFKRLDIIKLLVERGADINVMDKDRSTPLHFAAYSHGNLAVLTYLLQHGAKVDLVDDEGLLPIDYAKLAHDPDMINALAHAKRD